MIISQMLYFYYRNAAENRMCNEAWTNQRKRIQWTQIQNEDKQNKTHNSENYSFDRTDMAY